MLFNLLLPVMHIRVLCYIIFLLLFNIFLCVLCEFILFGICVHDTASLPYVLIFAIALLDKLLVIK